MIRRLLILFHFLCLPSLANGQDPIAPKEGESAEIISQVTSISAGDRFYVALQLKHEHHAHSYFSNPGASGDAPKIAWQLPDGFSASETLFTFPEVIKFVSYGNPTTIYGYSDSATFLFEITAPQNLPSEGQVTIAGDASWLVCDDKNCVPLDHEFSFTVTAGSQKVIDADQATYFQQALEKLPAPSGNWKTSVTEEDEVITLTLTAPEGINPQEPIYFFSTDAQVDSQADQNIEINGQDITLQIFRNVGNEELLITAAKVQDTLAGVFTYHDANKQMHGVSIAPSLVSDAQTSASSGGHGIGEITATDADREAGKAVYDINARPEIVTLSGEEEEELTFFYGLGLLFIGGLLLNLMPCVFPVLGIKVMSFVSQAGEDESKIKNHGLIFGLGLLIAMWVLAAIVISLGLKWGEQLSNPIFLVTMIMFFVLMGLNLFGIFEIGTSLTSVGGDLQSQKGYSGSFFSGVLTTLVATPCSGPFLGVAMAFALSLPGPQAFVAFTVFGLGIASPYILLSFFPALIKKLPRPGAWMVSFKQIMSFFLIATAVFFMKTYVSLVGESHFNFFLFALVIISMGAYIYGRWGVPSVPKGKRMLVGYGLSALLTFGGIAWAYNTAKAPKEEVLAWHEWYPGVIEKTRPKKRIIWLDYTADW